MLQILLMLSVTQSFNTTSSMGRLTLNVLLSFAQFEREVIRRTGARQDRSLQAQGHLGWRSGSAQLSLHRQEARSAARRGRDGPNHLPALS
jgi:DNA invertase Pin-like site-specific DNA recombinase